MTKYNCTICKEVFELKSANKDVLYCPFCGGIRPCTDVEKAKGERVNRKILQQAKKEGVGC